MKRSHGSYSKQSRNLKSKGRPRITKLMSEYAIGETVRIDASPMTKDGRPHLRFNKTLGKIVGRSGKAYKVVVTQGNAEKILVVGDVHLERI